MAYSQAQLESDGYLIKAAPVDDWRCYNDLDPVPFYFDFDWISARHPDLYHRFALSTDGLMLELAQLVDLSGLDVIDVGAGTGRSAIAAARRARSVCAVDIFESVVMYGMDQVHKLRLENISYIRGDRDLLPFADNSFDALINSYAELNYSEAFRVLKPNGSLVRLGSPYEAICGELTSTLAEVYPDIINEVAPDDWFDAGCPEKNTQFEENLWNELPVTPPTLQHDFTYIADYGDSQQAAEIFGRLYGPKARQYFLARHQSHVAYRLRIEVSHVKK